MRLVVTVGDRLEEVEIEQSAEGFEVSLGERQYTVDERSLGDGRWSLLVGGRQLDVSVVALDEGRYRVDTADGELRATVVDPLTHLAQKGAGRRARRSEEVTAYMPGRVVEVLVAEGDEVVAGQGLVVLEAMKMENEIAAEHDGVVKRIAVEAGQAVEGGDLLFELE